MYSIAQIKVVNLKTWEVYEPKVSGLHVKKREREVETDEKKNNEQSSSSSPSSSIVLNGIYMRHTACVISNDEATDESVIVVQGGGGSVFHFSVFYSPSLWIRCKGVSTAKIELQVFDPTLPATP